MKHVSPRSAVFVLAVTAAVCTGCSGSGQLPVFPDKGLPGAEMQGNISARPNLWGYYDVYIDVGAQSAVAVLNREAMFSANVVSFLNGSPANMQFKIWGTTVDPGGKFVDVDIDVTLRHPFPGMPQYNGYDVRGVFIGNGSRVLAYNSDLRYAAYGGTDQVMYDYQLTAGDPYPGAAGMPDGYTRWWNPQEFLKPGLFGYTPGKLATPGYTGTATLNPYKYFADGLGAKDSLWNFLTTTSGSGKFSSGSANTRNYYLRFPTPDPNVKFNYAVLASWKGEKETDHPANAPEAVGLSVSVIPDLYFVSSSDKGGKLKLDISIFRGWGETPSTIWIESTVLSSPFQMTGAAMTPVGGGSSWSTWHVEIPADNITGNQGNEFWVIPEYGAYNYVCDFGVPNLAGEDSLAAFFRYDLYVSPVPLCKDLVPQVSKLNGQSSFNAVTKPYSGWVITGDFFEDGTPAVAVNNGTADVAFGTNVQWVDVNTITFDIDLTGVPVGVYDIVVSNGCGSHKKGVGDDMLSVLKWIKVVGTPNIDVVTGIGTPKEISVDPFTDRAAITYGTFWRRWTNNYTTSSSNFSCWGGHTMGPMDVQSSLMFYGHNYFGYSLPLCFTWTDWDGGTYSSFWQPGPANSVKDIANLQGTNQLWTVFEWVNATGGPYCSFIRTWGVGLFDWPAHCAAPFYNGTGTTGVVMANIRGIDFPQYSGSGNPDIYFLEYLPATHSGVVEKWRVAYSPVYQNLSFGEGIFYEPLDITVDSAYFVYVLDKTADGKPVIWAFNPSGKLVGTTQPLTSAEVSGNPLRIDASLSPEPDEVHLLHSLGVTRFAM